MPAWLRLVLLACAATAAACAQPPARLTLSASGVGEEGRIIRAQLRRFAADHSGLEVALQVTPDAADQRHQLYVQWLNARAEDPDVLQLDIIWTAEFASAGWVRPLPDRLRHLDDFFPAAVDANRWGGALYAVPWFVDAGLLYWRTDLADAPPATLQALRDRAQALSGAGNTAYGLLWQGARYEGLVTVFLEHAASFGGGILDPAGRVVVDEPPAIRALTFMRDAVRDGIVPAVALAWQEEQVRLAFQNGEAAFMRNWPYAWALLQDAEASRVAGRVGIAPFPPAARGGRASAALGGAQLAVNAHSAEPELAWDLVAFLTAPEQMLERARAAAQLPARRSLYDGTALAAALPIPVADLRRALDTAVARPVTPVYSELSELLQVRLHRALTRQQEPAAALHDAAAEMRTVLRRSGLSNGKGR